MSDRALSGPRFEMTQFVVEASDWERQELWQRHALPEMLGGAQLDSAGPGPRVCWYPYPGGNSAVVGELDGHRVAIHLTWATIGDCLVMFWSPCSRVVDHAMCHDWLRANVPAYAAGRNGDAASFHECLAFVKVTP